MDVQGRSRCVPVCEACLSSFISVSYRDDIYDRTRADKEWRSLSVKEWHDWVLQIWKHFSCNMHNSGDGRFNTHTENTGSLVQDVLHEIEKSHKERLQECK